MAYSNICTWSKPSEPVYELNGWVQSYRTRELYVMVRDVLTGAVAADDTYTPMSRVTVPAAEAGMAPLMYSESAALDDVRTDRVAVLIMTASGPALALAKL